MIKIKACEVMQYFSYYDVQEIAVIESRIKSLTWIKKYAIIIHDKDLLDNWEKKGKHFHAVLTFDNATTISAVAKWMKVEEQYVNKIRTTTKSAFLYLVHRNDQEKFQYDPKEVIASFDYVEYVDGCKPRVKREDISERIANWEIKEYNLFNFITPDEFWKNKTYYDRCFLYRQWKMKKVNREMDCIYISWPSGVWKTSFAKMLAASKGYACYISDGGKNPLDNYKWEECIILDDLRDDTYTVSDFLKLTDNNTSSYVHCRFYNKSIAECKLLIITSVQPIKDFYLWQTNENESQNQVFRRLKTYIIMDTETAQFLQYNEKTNDYDLTFKVNNPVAQLFNPKVAAKFQSDIVKSMGLEIIKD